MITNIAVIIVTLIYMGILPIKNIYLKIASSLSLSCLSLLIGVIIIALVVELLTYINRR